MRRLKCGRIAAHRNGGLWTRSVQRKTAKVLPPPEKNIWLNRNMTARGGPCEANSQTVRPNNAVHVFVNSSLGQKLSEIDVRAKDCRVHVKFKTVVHACACLQRMVPRVADPDSSQC